MKLSRLWPPLFGIMIVLKNDWAADCKAGTGSDPEAALLEMADAKALLIDDVSTANGLAAAPASDGAATGDILGIALTSTPFAARKLIPAAAPAPAPFEIKSVIKLAGTLPPDASLTAAASVLVETGSAKLIELIVSLIVIILLISKPASVNIA